MPKVKVLAPYQIHHDGKAYTDGDTVEASQADVAPWIAAGYAEPVKAAKPKQKKVSEPKPSDSDK